MAKKHYRRFVVCALMVCMSSLAAALPPAGAAQKQILAIPAASLASLPAWVASKKGYFADEGLNVEVRRMRPPIAVKGVVAGEVAYTSALGSTVRAAVSGVKVKAIMTYLGAPYVALMAKGTWKNIESLRGEPKQIIGTEPVGGTMDYLVRQILRQHGLTPGKDVLLRVVGFQSQRVKALMAKQIDAAMVMPPTNELLKDQGYNELVFATDVLKQYAIGGLGVTLKRIKEDREGLKKAIRAQLKALNFLNTDLAGSAEILATWLKVKLSYAKRTAARFPQVYPRDGKVRLQSIRQHITLAKRRLKLTKDIPIEQVIDYSLIDEVLKQ